jgi:hypothetical protein
MLLAVAKVLGDDFAATAEGIGTGKSNYSSSGGSSNSSSGSNNSSSVPVTMSSSLIKAVAIAGTFPPGVGEDVYAQICSMAGRLKQRNATRGGSGNCNISKGDIKRVSDSDSNAIVISGGGDSEVESGWRVSLPVLMMDGYKGVGELVGRCVWWLVC